MKLDITQKCENHIFVSGKTFSTYLFDQSEKNKYIFNSDGFRMKEFSDINSRYIAFLGCSSVLGEGVSIEDTYSYKVCRELVYECVNLGVSGSSNDYSLYLLEQLVKSDRLPSAIVISWTSLYRFDIWDEEKNIMQEWKPWNLKNGNKKYIDFISEKSNVINHFKQIRKKFKEICAEYDIPVYELTYFDHVQTAYEFNLSGIPLLKRMFSFDEFNVKKFTNDHLADDLSHPSPEGHDEVKDWLISEMVNL